MRVKVRPMRRFGQLHRFKEIEAMPPHVGVLKVNEVRDLRLERRVICAQLLDLRNEAHIIPALSDARLLWAEDGQMRMTGIERVGDSEYAQTWAIELA